MSEEIQKLDEDEIDLLDLFIVLLRHRRVILVSIFAAIILVVVGYFIYPGYKLSKLEKQDYVVANMNISTNAALLEYDITIDKVSETFRQAELILNSILMGNNSEMLFVEDDDSVKDFSIIKDRMIPEKTTSYSLSSYRCEYPLKLNWLYDVKVRTNTINLTFLLQNTDTEIAKNLLNNLYIQSNSTILNMIRSNVKMKLDTYQAALASKSNVQDPVILLNEISHAQGLLDNKILPLIKLSDPIAYIEGPNKSLKKIKNNYIKKGIILILAVIFLSIFLSFILEFMHNIKNDEERMKKIRDALGK